MIEIIQATKDKMPCIPEIAALIVEHREPLSGELALATTLEGKYSFGRFQGWRIQKDGLTLYPTVHDLHHEEWTISLKELDNVHTVIGLLWSKPIEGELIYKAQYPMAKE